jgi:hypothetical protein
MDGMPSKVFARGTDYVDFLQTELLVKMQLLKWLLQFMHAGKLR